MTRATVVGAGIVGLCTALYLQKSGRQVTLIDPLSPGAGTSSGNAGIISVGSVHPESMPGIWKEIPEMLLQPQAPVKLRPGYLLPFTPWLMRFLANSSAERSQRSAAAIHALTSRGLDYLLPLARQAAALDLIQQQGSLYVYARKDQFEKARRDNVYRERLGANSEIIEASELNDIDPCLASGLAGAILNPDAGHTVSPLRLSQALFRLFSQQGGEFIQTRVTHFDRLGNRVTRLEACGFRAIDELFITAGAYSKELARLLGSSMLLDTERGYHLLLPQPEISLRRPVLFPPQAFAATMMTEGLRLAGTVEFAGLSAAPDYRRAFGMAVHARRLLPGLKGEGQSPWMGYRPSLPDSLPVISRSPWFNNVYFGFGHGHLGLTMAAVTGATLAAMAAGESPPVDTSPYRIDRKI